MVKSDQSRFDDAFALDLRNRLRSHNSVRTSPLSIVLFIIAAFLGAWSVLLQIRRGKNGQHVRQLHYQRAPSRRGSLLRRGNGAFRGRV